MSNQKFINELLDFYFRSTLLCKKFSLRKFWVQNLTRIFSLLFKNYFCILTESEVKKERKKKIRDKKSDARIANQVASTKKKWKKFSAFKSSLNFKSNDGARSIRWKRVVQQVQSSSWQHRFDNHQHDRRPRWTPSASHRPAASKNVFVVAPRNQALDGFSFKFQCWSSVCDCGRAKMQKFTIQRNVDDCVMRC